MSEDECCSEEIDLLKKELSQWSLKVKQLKDEYKVSLVTNLQKDLIIRDLRQQIKSIKYIKFEANISNSCLDRLRSIGDTCKEDSIFVGVLLKDLYSENGALKQKSLSGRSKTGEKSEFTPEKKQLLEEIYKERMSYLQPSQAEIRKDDLKKYIRNAIDVAVRKK